MLSPATAQHYWTQALDHTRSRSPATFEQWFASVQFDGVEEGVVRLTARDEFVRDWVADHFLPTLKGRLEDLLGGELSVRWQVDKNLIAPVCPPPSLQRGGTRRPVSSIPPASDSAPSEHRFSTPPLARSGRGQTGRDQRGSLGQGSLGQGSPAQGSPAQDWFGQGVSGQGSAGQGVSGQGAGATGAGRGPSTRDSFRPTVVGSSTPSSVPPGPSSALNPKFTFENFIVGSSNELAHAAAYASAGGGGPRYNPLFIAGGTGLGKTHLMHAIAHKVLGDRPFARIVYVSAEHFTNEFIEALQNHRMEEFRARYRGHCDVLLVDDIQFLAGREQTQEEFFHTFNALHDAGVPIVVTSDKYPQQLQRMPDRLVSRFTSGLVADVQAPQLETRVAILKKKAQLEQINLPDAVAVLLAQKIQSNVRELEGSLIRLAAKASLTGRHIDEALMKSEISLVTAPSQKLVCVADIQKAVCSHFRLTSADLLSKDRHKSVAFARQVAMYLCRQRLKSSFPELGRAFGNRDHTTVISAVKRVESLRKRDPQVNAHLEAIERRLASSDES
jgi:chromosomal replication initiator protein